MSKLLRISTYTFISIIIGAIIIASLSSPFGIELGITLKVIIMILGTMAFGLLAITWIQYTEKYYDNIIPETPSSTESKLSLDSIVNFIREEGYDAIQGYNGDVSFMVNGENYNIFYEDNMLTLSKIYFIGRNVDSDILYKAWSLAHDELCMSRCRLHKYGNDYMGLSFEIAVLVYSANEFERFFQNYVNILLHSIARHKSIYAKLYQEKNKNMQKEDIHNYFNI